MHHERRQWKRYSSAVATLYQPAAESDEPNLAARIRDISSGGIGLLVRQRHDPGDLLHVEMPKSSKAQSNSLLTCVVHASDIIDEEDYSLGCSFIRELSNDELESFL